MIINFWSNLKKEFKRTIKWNKCRLEVSNQTKNNNLNYLIDPTFIKVNRLFVLSFKNEDDRFFCSECYTPSVEIKEVTVLIDDKNFFDTPMKNKKETNAAIIEMGKNNDLYNWQFIRLWLFFKALKSDCNRFKLANGTKKP